MLSENSLVSKEIILELVATYMRINGLQQLDRLSMSRSIEIRNPFVDHRVVEFAIAASEFQNNYKLPPKNLIREYFAFHDEDRYQKKGFKPPIIDWYKRIHFKFWKNLTNMRLVDLGITNVKVIKYLSNPLTFFGRAKILWLDYLVLEFWIRQIETELVAIDREFKVCQSM
jgi:hypothetical protein